MAKFLSICLFLYLFLLSPSSVLASNLLLNPSFEEVSSDTPLNWVKDVGTMSVSTFSPGADGVNSVAINKQNGKIGSIYISQEVDIEPESYYKLTGKVKKNSPAFSYALLRIYWIGVGSDTKTTDSPKLIEDSAEYKTLSIEAVQAPNFAIKAKIRLVAYISSPDPQIPVLFDEISFTQISPPEQPTAVITPTPTSLVSTPTPTKTPAPTPIKTPTPTLLLKSPTPSLSKSPTPFLSPSIMSTSNSPEELQEEVLGVESRITPTPTIIVEQLQYEDNTSSISAVILMGIGGFLLLFCAIIIYRSWLEQKG